MKTQIKGGYIHLARQIIESEIFSDKPDKWFKIWLYLISKAKWRDGKQLKQGQCFMKYAWISEATKANKNQIDHCIRWLKLSKQITTQKATRGLIVTICKYGIYQDLNNYKSETETRQDTNEKRNRSETDLKKKVNEKRNKSDTILNAFNADKEVKLTSKDLINLNLFCSKSPFDKAYMHPKSNPNFIRVIKRVELKYSIKSKGLDKVIEKCNNSKTKDKKTGYYLDSIENACTKSIEKGLEEEQNRKAAEGKQAPESSEKKTLTDPARTTIPIEHPKREGMTKKDRADFDAMKKTLGN